MINKNRNILLAIFILTLTILGCSSLPQQVEPTAAVQVQRPSVTEQPQGDISQTEANVPRISAEDAKAALDDGKAIIVDVRSAEFYAAGHIAGAVSIPLTEIEADPTKLTLDKGQWIITYCT